LLTLFKPFADIYFKGIIMNVDLITRMDLEDLKKQIVEETIAEMKKIFDRQTTFPNLKNKDVRELLGCSDSKLESLRNSGKLQFFKVEGTIYYKREDIDNLFLN